MNVARGQLEELLPLAGREDHTSLTLPHVLDMAEIENQEQLETQKPRQILPKLHSFKELERPVVEPQRHQERLQLAKVRKLCFHFDHNIFPAWTNTIMMK